jgi:hypothetical protein
MPFLSCLVGHARPTVLAALAQEPHCSDSLFRFNACEGVRRAAGGLAVVRLSGAVEAPWVAALDDDAAEKFAQQMQLDWRTADLPHLGLMQPPFEHHVWLAEALPPTNVVSSWARLSCATGERLAFWWWWERGDDLYADAAWLFAPEGQAIVARDVLAADQEAIYLYEEHARSDSHWGSRSSLPVRRALSGSDSPFGVAMKHLGGSATLPYFPPAENWHFDWEPFRYTSPTLAS